MMNLSIKKFFSNLETEYINALSSSSTAGYLAHIKNKDEAWGDKTLAILKYHAERAASDMNEYLALQGEALFECVVQKQTASLSGSEQKKIASKVREMLTEHGYQLDDNGTPMRIDLAKKDEMISLCKEAANCFSCHFSKTTEDSNEKLMAALYLACTEGNGICDEQAEVIGYCFGLVQSASCHIHETHPMHAYDEFFTDDTTLILYVISLCVFVSSAQGLLTSSILAVNLLYFPIAIALVIGLLFFFLSMQDGRIREEIETRTIAHKAYAASKAIVEAHVHEHSHDKRAQHTHQMHDAECSVTA